MGALSFVAFFHGGRLPQDLHIYIDGGSAIVHGHNLYGAGVAVEGAPFTYPPFAALPFAVVSILPTLLVIAVSCLVFYGCFAAVLQLCSPGLLRRAATSWPSWLVVAAFLAFNPVWATAKEGQVNMILAALVLADLLCARRGRGSFVGVAAAIKLTPAIFVIYLLATRQWNAARNAVLGFLACTGLTWLALPADSHRYWLHTLFQTSRIGQPDQVSNQSLLGLCSKEFHKSTTTHVAWVVLALLATTVAIWSARHLHAAGHEVLTLGLIGVLGCLLSPITWTHHWVWIVPVILGIMSTPAWRSTGCKIAVAVLALIFIRGASEAPPNIFLAHLVLANLYTVAGLLIVASTGIAAYRSAHSQVHDT